MHIILCDTRKLDVSKDFAGGMGVGLFPAHGGLRGWIIRHGYTRDRRPVALLFAHLAAIFRQQGHQVEYCEDRPAGRADLYVFCPALVTMHVERQTMAQILRGSSRGADSRRGNGGLGVARGVFCARHHGGKRRSRATALETGRGARASECDGATGDHRRSRPVPLPDWSPFGPHRFRIGYDFWRFPTAFVQASRGCTFACSYCPDIVLENTARFRDPQAVAEEIRSDMQRWGFRSFKFRDPLFGLDRRGTYRLAELLGNCRRRSNFPWKPAST